MSEGRTVSLTGVVTKRWRKVYGPRKKKEKGGGNRTNKAPCAWTVKGTRGARVCQIPEAQRGGGLGHMVCGGGGGGGGGGHREVARRETAGVKLT